MDLMFAKDASAITARPRFLHIPQVISSESLKHQHVPSILSDADPVSFLEVHAENYMGAGGPPHRILESVRRDYPISLHGVCMSIGGPESLDKAHLQRFRDLVLRYEPMLVSEHLAWSTHDQTYFNDLLPLPYCETTLARVCDHIDEFQDVIGRPMLLENPSSYLVFCESTMDEAEFLRAIAKRTGCGLLLDVNNLFISSTNLGFSPRDYLADFPLSRVGEIHLAGHSQQVDDDGVALLIDSHDRPVAEPVWALYEAIIPVTGPIPTLIEWDSNLPDWPVLKAEATAVQAVLDRCTSLHPERNHAA